MGTYHRFFLKKYRRFFSYEKVLQLENFREKYHSSFQYNLKFHVFHYYTDFMGTYHGFFGKVSVIFILRKGITTIFLQNNFDFFRENITKFCKEHITPISVEKKL